MLCWAKMGYFDWPLSWSSPSDFPSYDIQKYGFNPCAKHFKTTIFIVCLSSSIWNVSKLPSKTSKTFGFNILRAASQSEATLENYGQLTMILSLDSVNSANPRPHFYQPGSAWSMDQGSNENHSPVNNFTPTVTKFCVTWEGQALPHDTKFCNSRGKIVGSRMFPYWSLIHGSSWSGLIKAGPGELYIGQCYMDKRSRNMTHYLVGWSNMTLEVAGWETQLSNMIKRKTCKFCVNNWKTNFF